MKIINCTFDQHGEAILAILNQAIIHSTALYDYKPRTIEMMREWFETKQNNNFPIIGQESPAGELMGFATYGTFRVLPAFKYTVEHSVYIDPAHRGKGLARKLMAELIERAKQQEIHTLIGAIDASNQASVALHQSLGFRHCASIKEVGFKFGQWLDVEFYQLILPTPQHPIDG